MKKRITALLVALVAVSMCLVVAGCGGLGTSSEEKAASEQKVTLDTIEIKWDNYTMGMDQITDDSEIVKPAGIDVEGKLVKVCFRYLNDTDNQGGFVSATIFDSLQEHPITLQDKDGKTYDYTGSIGNFLMKGDFATDGFSMEDLQPRFSITFDVPADSNLEDFVLHTGDAQEVKLMSYTSDEYNAEYADKK